MILHKTKKNSILQLINSMNKYVMIWYVRNLITHMATPACVPEPFLVCIDCFILEVIPKVCETRSPNAIVTTTLCPILTNLRSYANIWVYLFLGLPLSFFKPHHVGIKLLISTSLSMSSLPLLLFNWRYADNTLNLGLLWHYQPEKGMQQLSVV
jgi:hypothetical protein